MDEKTMDERVIENYEAQEKNMILIFAQWCINYDLDPLTVYSEAYPDQMKNNKLSEVLDYTVAKEEADEIGHETVLYALQLFGNDDLAFVVQEKIVQLEKKQAEA